MKIGFALICASPLFDNIINIENAVHDRAGFFDKLGVEKNLPHTTLFQGEMADSTDYGGIAEKISVKVKELIPNRKINFSQVVYVPQGWYFYECAKTSALQELHDYTLDLVEPFIVLQDNRLDRELSGMPREQVEGLKKYGYRYSGPAFYPHITLGRAQKKDDGVIAELNGAVGSTGKQAVIDRVTVYRMGNNGTHERTLYEIKL